MSVIESSDIQIKFPHIATLLNPIKTFLQCSTPDSWISEAVKPENLTVLLVDHCKCELKAAQTGLLMMRKYALSTDGIKQIEDWVKPYESFVYHDKKLMLKRSKQEIFNINPAPKDDDPLTQSIIKKMVALVKEELQHFEQVLQIIESRDLEYVEISASRYAKALIKKVRTYEPAGMVDKLIIGAYIEARSCERFAKLAPHLDEELGTFYFRLLKSEARHYDDYLSLARRVAEASVKEMKNFDSRVKEIGELEAELILSGDDDFRFHSGVPN